MDIRQKVATHLRVVRELKGFSPQQAAQRIKTSDSYIYRLEKGLNSPTIDKLAALCAGYGITLAKFFGSMGIGNVHGNGKKSA